MQTSGLFTEVNDWLRTLASGSTAQRWDFICECPDASCEHSVSLTVTEFDKRRAASPPVPVRAAEHDN